MLITCLNFWRMRLEVGNGHKVRFKGKLFYKEFWENPSFSTLHTFVRILNQYHVWNFFLSLRKLALLG